MWQWAGIGIWAVARGACHRGVALNSRYGSRASLSGTAIHMGWDNGTPSGAETASTRGIKAKVQKPSANKTISEGWRALNHGESRAGGRPGTPEVKEVINMLFS